MSAAGATHRAATTTTPTPTPNTRDLRAAASRLVRAAEFGDWLLLVYAAAFVRQYFWALQDNGAAWTLTLVCTLILWLTHLRLKGDADAAEKTPPPFWLIVGLPLAAVYLLRFTFPDLSFDVLNNRLVQAERSLRGVLFMPGDFFPTILPVNPAPDMVTGLSRMLLGYRLGTIVNLLALLWAGTILERMLRPYVRGARLRAFGVLLVLFTEHALFEISTYMVDILSLPLMLEAARLALSYGDSSNKGRDLVYGAMLVGASLAMKLTNAVVVVPLVLVFAYQVLASRGARGPAMKTTLAHVALAAVACLLPLLPHAVYIYRETGSPFFPLYNEIFKSPYWPLVNASDGRWGPQGLWQTLAWPVLMPFKTERLCEQNLAVYAGRLSLGFLAALVCLVLPGLDRRARLLAFVTAAGSMLWAATSGYARYMLPLELTGGVLLLCLAHLVAERTRALTRHARAALVAVVWCALFAQTIAAGVFVYGREWGGRPTVFDQPKPYIKEASQLLRDRSLPRYLAPGERELLDGVGAWVVTGVKSNGVEMLLRGDVPVLALHNPEYFGTPAGREKFARTRRGLADERMYSLCMADELTAARERLTARGLRAGEVTRLQVPFFSKHRQLHMALFEVLPLAPASASGGAALPGGPGPLPDTAYRAAISLPSPPARMSAGASETLTVVVRNDGDYAWPARGQDGSAKYAVTVADSWLDARTAALVNNLDGRASLPRDLAPGETVEVQLRVTAPQKPGDYILELDMVQEQVAFFKDWGSEPLRVTVQVR